MKRQKKASAATSSAYPQYCFRIPEHRQDQFDRVMAAIDKLEAHYKKTQGPDEKAIRRNDILIEALELGIKELKKQK